MREHLARCADCAAHERSLAAVTPQAFLTLDPTREAELWARLDAAVQAELDRPPRVRPPRPSDRVMRWLAAETRLPTAAVLGYAALLAMALGWGVSNWRAATHLQAAVAQSEARVAGPAPATLVDVPADQYLPAAYAPDERPDAPPRAP